MAYTLDTKVGEILKDTHAWKFWNDMLPVSPRIP